VIAMSMVHAMSRHPHKRSTLIGDHAHQGQEVLDRPWASESCDASRGGDSPVVTPRPREVEREKNDTPPVVRRSATRASTITKHAARVEGVIYTLYVAGLGVTLGYPPPS